MLTITLRGDSSTRKPVLVNALVKEIKGFHPKPYVMITDRIAAPYPRILKLRKGQKRPDIWIRVFTTK